MALAGCAVVTEDTNEYSGAMIIHATAENAIKARNNFLIENEFVISTYHSAYTMVLLVELYSGY